MANTFGDTGGTTADEEEERRREDVGDGGGSNPPSSSPSEGARRAVERDQQRDTDTHAGADSGEMVDRRDDVQSGFERAVEQDPGRDTSEGRTSGRDSGGTGGEDTGDGDGLTDAQRQNVQAAFQRDVEGFGQGIEQHNQRAREFEQEITSTEGQLDQVQRRIASEFDETESFDVRRVGDGRYTATITTADGRTVTRRYGVADDPSEVRIGEEDDQLVAEYTDAGLEAAGVNPTTDEIREQVAEDSQYDAEDLQVSRTRDGVEVTLTPRAQRAREREYGTYLLGIARLARNDPGRGQAIVDAAPRGAQRAVEETPEPGPVLLRDLSADQQREVNEDLISQYSTAVGARERRRTIANTEFRNDDVTLFRIEGTSPEEFTRGVSSTIRGGAGDVANTLAPEDRRFVVPTTSGVFVFEGDSEIAGASRGAVQSAGDFAAAPFDAALAAKELGEFGAEGGRSARAGEGGEFVEDTERAGRDLAGAVIGQFRENPAEMTTRLAGTAVLTGGAIQGARLAGGGRAARATSFAIQPGEEIALSAGRRARSALPDVRAREFLGEERGQFDFSERTTRSGREKTIEVEEGSELAAEIEAAREEFLERTRIREEPGELDVNTEDVTVGETRQQQRFDTDDTATTAEERLPAREEFESDAAYERELEAMRDRINQEERATDVDTERGRDLATETTAAVAAAGLAAQAETTGATAFGTEPATDTRIGFGTLGGDTMTGFGTRGLTEIRAATDTRLDQKLDLARELDLSRELTTETTTDLTTDYRTGLETTREFTTETTLEVTTETMTETEERTRFDLEMEAEAEQMQIGATRTVGGSRRAGEAILGPGWFAETAQGFVVGAFTDVGSPSQETLREIAVPGTDLPTAGIASGEVDIEPVYDLYNLDDERSGPFL